RHIEDLVGGTGYHSVDTGRVGRLQPARAMSYADMAVLFRTVDQIRPVAAAFEARGIPLQMVSRRHTLETKGIARLLSLAKLALGAGSYGDLAASARSLTPGLNRKLIGLFRSWGLASRMGVSQGLACAARFPVPGLSRRQQVTLVEFTGALKEVSQTVGGMKSAGEKILYLSRLPKLAEHFADPLSRDALERLLLLVAGMDDRPSGFWGALTLQVDTDTFHPRAEKVALMTMHASKGLEFPLVFIAGCEEGLIPFRRREETPAEGEEERRLFYVAMTRAKERLFLTWSRRRKIFGKAEERRPSPYISDIEQRLIKEESERGRRRRKGTDQLQLF
ncbi:MAG: ATP-dependent helicase, partial [Desulfobacteraceae bacterium]